ncbi:hypothetical protein I2492_18840 [Budviciaceae bacterium CWB-B4]|uniref:Uncharacterized protein n=1 Tax=Limnobaculum xujianqingii TaxID=2738837 RepID=A0A9D7G0B0_9GAMM|nr:hypothetical protein [Limnobaculum xujianqingii]MBK5075094.1 hypothetical protein [Limnobaculum xujianqingii]MBK5178371.1 hypothetical protein [Limnobaculum xujianqingii]
MAKNKATDAASEEADLITVVVLKGKSVRHDGKGYTQNSRVELSENDASQLIASGFVKTLDAVKQEMEEASGQEVSIAKADGQSTITSDAPSVVKSESGEA